MADNFCLICLKVGETLKMGELELCKKCFKKINKEIKKNKKVYIRTSYIKPCV